MSPSWSVRRGDARNPEPDRDEIERVLALVSSEASTYLAGLDDRPAMPPGAGDAARSFRGRLPEHGTGATAALRELLECGLPASGATSGPRFFHWVVGGVTPAALGADLLATVLDQPAYAWNGTPLGVELEIIALGWLAEMFGLRPDMAGIMTTGASMANFVGLASARQWWGERHGVDVSQTGLAGLPRMPVLAGDTIHASSVKVLAMLGCGRDVVTHLSRDDTGIVDLDRLEDHLRALNGAPAVLIAAAGEVNAGAFDPIADMADLAERYGAWLHVDGAFGLFAALSLRTAALVAGVDRADSVTVDGHKWLNVPYDCGFSFVRDRGLMQRSFAYTAHYLNEYDEDRPTMGVLGPESSRRARSLAVWSTLRAYGRAGYQAMVERHLDLARHMADRVRAAPDLELLAEPTLSVVTLRWNPGDVPEPALDALNLRLGERLLEDGRVYAGTTRYRGRVALRPTIVNWRTRRQDVELFVDVVRELAAELAVSV